MELKDRFRSFLPVVVDVETGGTNPNEHALLELCATFLNWDNDRLSVGTSHTWSINPHPATGMTDKSIEITSIDPADPSRVAIEEEIAIRDCFRLIRRTLKEVGCTRAVLTGHNAHFDHAFVFAAATRNKVGQNPFHPFTVLDTASICAVSVGHTVLHEAAYRLGIEYERTQAHSAQYDAEVAALVFCEVVNRTNYSVVV